jgi:NADPH:quinone reductase-like Zn-dependent oxidoreductase
MDLLNVGNEPTDNSHKTEQELVNDVIMEIYNGKDWDFLFDTDTIRSIQDEDLKTQIISLVLIAPIIQAIETSGEWRVRITPQGNVLLKKHGSFTAYLEAVGDEIKAKEEKAKGLESLQVENLRLAVDKLRKEVSDYDDTKNRAKTSLVMSKVSIGLSIAIPLILLMLKWKCNLPS